MSDGYEVYKAIAATHGAIHLGYWSHARRYFVEAVAAIPSAARNAQQTATQFIAAIGRLYAIEANAKDLITEQRRRRRQEQRQPVLASIEALLIQQQHALTPVSLLGKALHYISSQ